jgi:predicted nucleic acid-binding protein
LILVDSSVWIDYFNGKVTWQTNLLDRKLSDELLVVGDLILTEVLQGFRSDKDYQTAKSFLSAMLFRSMGGYNVAIQSAGNYRKLRKSGITVRKTIDVIIATFCIVEDLALLHDDRDFEPMTTVLTLKACSPK